MDECVWYIGRIKLTGCHRKSCPGATLPTTNLKRSGLGVSSRKLVTICQSHGMDILTYLITYLFTYLPTPLSRVLETITISQLVKKFPTFYGT
jgi:hypothetical protein